MKRLHIFLSSSLQRSRQQSLGQYPQGRQAQQGVQQLAQQRLRLKRACLLGWLLFVSLALTAPLAQAQAFVDIATSNHREAIVALSQRGIVQGYPDGRFAPEQQVSRAELVTLALRSAGLLSATATQPHCFADVPLWRWYSQAVCTAAAYDLLPTHMLQQDEAGQSYFFPQQSISYAEAEAIVQQSFALSQPVSGVYSASSNGYQDYPSAVNEAVNGTVNGEALAAPQAPLSREVMAALVYRQLTLRQDMPAAQQELLHSDRPESPERVLRRLVELQPVLAYAAPQRLEALPAAPADTPDTPPDMPDIQPDPNVQLDRDSSDQTRYSPGCGRLAPARPLQQLYVGGRSRELIAVVPATYRPDVAHRLVVAFHGRTSPNHEVRRYFDLERHASNTIFLYPAGLPHGQGRSWSDPQDRSDTLRDYALFDSLLAEYSQAYCLDMEQVYVVGHSLGAWFANSLACARSQHIRAVASLAGGISAAHCGHVAAMLMHNPNDRAVPIDQGVRARDLYIESNTLALQSNPSNPSFLNCRRYGGSSTPYPVVWCPHTIDIAYGGRYYPHHWPRGTGEAIMAFFSSLP